MTTSNPAPQKSLIVIFRAGQLGESGINGLSVWYWSEQDAAAWLAPRRQMFPGASGQEMVSLALLPEDAKTEMAEVLCGSRKGRPVEDSVADPLAFSILSESCAVCVLQVLAMDKGARGKKAIEKATALFDARVRVALPGTFKDEEGLVKALGSENLESGLRAAYDKSKLLSVEPVDGDKRPKKRPGL